MSADDRDVVEALADSPWEKMQAGLRGVRITPVPMRPTIELNVLELLVLLQVDDAVGGRNR